MDDTDNTDADEHYLLFLRVIRGSTPDAPLGGSLALPKTIHFFNTISLFEPPMRLTYTCPKCNQPIRVELPPGVVDFACSACGQTQSIPPGALDDEGLHRCLVCPGADLYLRKDFPQRLGFWIVVLGLGASCVTWGFYERFLTYTILFATALVDVVLYLFVPNALMCYRCGAQYRGAPGLDSHEPFQLETHERYRQQTARLADHQRS